MRYLFLLLFLAGLEDDLGVAEGEPLEDVVFGGHHVEELVVARAVEDGVSDVAGLGAYGYCGAC